jgi:hypothetical protein
MAWACFYGAPTVPTSLKITKDGGVYVLFRSSELTLKPIRPTGQVRLLLYPCTAMLNTTVLILSFVLGSCEFPALHSNPGSLP